MAVEEDMRCLGPVLRTGCPSSAHVVTGVPILPQHRVGTFSPEEWESFTEEWAASLEDTYVRVARFGGSGDLGIDVVGYISDTTFEGGWDNYQCKRYDHALRPADVWKEIGKIIYYSFKGEYSAPRKYFFVASKDIGTGLQKLLGNPNKLKESAKAAWDQNCRDKITFTCSIPLESDLLEWFEEFDFSIFSAKSVVDLISDHSKTRYHAIRFGGGLPPRPNVMAPPDTYESHESRYIQQLFDAYEDKAGIVIIESSSLASLPRLRADFLRQRERFYHAESLRNFARDTVPEGTFEGLQEEIRHGVIDICEMTYENGFERMQTTLTQAGQIPVISNPLSSVTKVQDKQGICHQLANDDLLLWILPDEEVLK